MNIAMRRGACPALSAPMQTGDGLLVRLNLIEGGLPPATLAALCDHTARHGNGIVEVTTRGSFQVRGLTATSAPLLAEDVAALELDLREGVPVETSPLAGLDPDEIGDPLPLARAIRTAVGAAGLASRLAPKVSVVVDGGGNIDLAGILADVRVTAREDRRWALAAGGDAASARPLAVLDESDVAATVVAVLEAVAALGRSARARDLAKAEITALLSPFTGRGCRQAGEGQRDSSTLAPPPIRPFGAPSPRNRGEGIALSDGRVAVIAALPFGSVRSADLAAFARRAETHGVSEFRLAPGRALILLCPSEAAAIAARDAAVCAGLILDPADPRRAIAACPGAPACASGNVATRDIASALASEWRDLFDGSLSLHVSGCAKGCAHPSPAALTLVGEHETCALVVGGVAGGEALARVAKADVPSALRRLAEFLRDARRDCEPAEATLRRADAAALARTFLKG